MAVAEGTLHSVEQIAARLADATEPWSQRDNGASQHAVSGVSVGSAGRLVIEFSVVLNYVPLPCLRSELIFPVGHPAVG
jgi:hypothetical protein